jgi:hypothetical protein
VKPVRYASIWAAWLALLFWLWFVLVGEWNEQEIVAALCTGAVAAGAATVVSGRVLPRFRVPLDVVRGSKTVLPMVFVDFGLVMFALWRSLVRRRVVRGVFRANEIETGGGDPRSRGRRAWITVAATYSPNAYVVDVNPARGTALVHDLLPRGRHGPLGDQQYGADHAGTAGKRGDEQVGDGAECGVAQQEIADRPEERSEGGDDREVEPCRNLSRVV